MSRSIISGIIRDNLAGGDRSTKNRLVPYGMFADPTLADAALSERAEIEETDRFMKVLERESDDRILGFTMIRSDAGDVQAAVAGAPPVEMEAA